MIGIYTHEKTLTKSCYSIVRRQITWLHIANLHNSLDHHVRCTLQTGSSFTTCLPAPESIRSLLKTAIISLNRLQPAIRRNVRLALTTLMHEFTQACALVMPTFSMRAGTWLWQVVCFFRTRQKNRADGALFVVLHFGPGR